jgi:hypothetical protein
MIQLESKTTDMEWPDPVAAKAGNAAEANVDRRKR